MAKQAVAKKKIQEVVLTEVDNLFEAHAGEGLATAPTDTVIPLLKIFQDLSNYLLLFCSLFFPIPYRILPLLTLQLI